MHITLGLLALITCTLVTLQLRAPVAVENLPPRFPNDRNGTDRPRTWIFVRPGCGHCEAHLRALERASRRLEPARRRRVLDHVRVVGSNAAIPPGVRTEPDSLRRTFGVRMTPTTVFVGADGAIVDVWRGARGARAWERVIDRMDGGKER